MSTDAEQTSEGIDNLRKNRDELASQLSEVQGKYRGLLAETTFKEAGLNQKHADLFLKVSDAEADITVDAVKAFAAEYGLTPAAPEGQPKPAASTQPEGQVQQPNPTPSGLAGMSGAGATGTGANPPSSPGAKLSMTEFTKLMQTDRAAATQAYAEGRVEHAEGNVFVDQAKRAGVIE